MWWHFIYLSSLKIWKSKMEKINKCIYTCELQNYETKERKTMPTSPAPGLVLVCNWGWAREINTFYNHFCKIIKESFFSFGFWIWLAVLLLQKTLLCVVSRQVPPRQCRVMFFAFLVSVLVFGPLSGFLSSSVILFL